MEQQRLLVTPTTTCQCVRWHRPKIRIIDVHHVVPLSWGGKDVKENRIPICPNTHRLVHELLDLYKKKNGFVFQAELQPFPRYTKKLAERGWIEWNNQRAQGGAG